MSRLFLFLLQLLLTLVVLGAALWGAGLLVFRLPGATGIAGAIGFGLAGLAGAIGLWTGAPRLPLSFAVLFVGLLGWWSSLQPSHNREWIPELARLPQIAREGERLTVTNLRNFRWRTEADYDERWETRSYDLAKVEGVDLFLSYWSGEAIAHLLVSFTFEDSLPLTFSIEVRREKGEEWSSLAGFFRVYEMAYVAADERDVVGLRTHARGEDVRMFRLRASPERARDVLLAYVEDINRLAREPRWYNTIATNCTTVVYRLVGSVAPGWSFTLPLDPRVVLSGYLPGYLKDIGAVRQDLPLAELVRLGRISERARTVSLDSPDFSRLIREGVPSAQP
ncbi:Lnb N-terminal periplasmic domain-containing protein [Bosea sp. (in: a-proteobacteria)]|uniref:Lnb N-terminal periplasmic domain-containing protein n=1 Tax=Bosea sp. (in: a-proteobacteria) TaxID=1871050 RepID=UPI002FC6B295